MIESIVSASAGIKGAIDIAKGINATVTGVQIAEAKIDLLERLSDAQIALADAREQMQLLREKCAALQTQIDSMEKFDAEAEGYSLDEAGKGVLAYRKRNLESDAGSSQWYCPNCFGDRRLSLLIPESHGYYATLRCHPCEWNAVVNGRRNDKDRR